MSEPPVVFTCARCGAKGDPPPCDHFAQPWSVERIAEAHRQLTEAGLTPPESSGLVAQLRAHIASVEKSGGSMLMLTLREAREVLDALIASSPTTAATGAPQCPMCAGKGWCSPEDAERGIQENGKVYTAGYELGKQVALSTGGSSSPAHEPDGWQPIETAPKDGTWIAVTSTHNRYYRAAVQFALGQWLDTREASHDDFMETAATHWRPLPAPPSGDLVRTDPQD